LRPTLRLSTALSVVAPIQPGSFGAVPGTQADLGRRAAGRCCRRRPASPHRPVGRVGVAPRLAIGRIAVVAHHVVAGQRVAAGAALEVGMVVAPVSAPTTIGALPVAMSQGAFGVDRR
jgi:hypothetical protein